MKRHFLIPDTQVKPGVPMDHFRWLGRAIKKYEPDVVIHLGDHWDMKSLSSWDGPGSLAMEGARYEDDVAAGNEALQILHDAMGGYKCRKVILRGNHEHRIQRAMNKDARFAGTIGYHHFNDRRLGWEPVDYVGDTPGQIVIDGVTYAHYFASLRTGRPIGGAAQYKLAAIGTPFVMGHVQGVDIGTKQWATGRTIRGIVAGSCYLHDEEYIGVGNEHDRGAIVLNNVRDGKFSIMDLDFDYLCKNYGGNTNTVARFLQRKYRNAKERFSLATRKAA
jgi:hypothetical protein